MTDFLLSFQISLHWFFCPVLIVPCSVIGHMYQHVMFSDVTINVPPVVFSGHVFNEVES